MSVQTTSAPIEKPPVTEVGVIGWLRANLFNSPFNSVLTIACFALIVYILQAILPWALFKAVWSGTPKDCQVEGVGACWAVISEKNRFTLFGRYTYDEQWRPAVAILLFLGLIGLSCFRRFWGKALIWAWVSQVFIWAVLMWGGVLGLKFVSHEQWGGLPLTLMMSVVAIVVAYPIGIVLALGRRSDMPVARSLCVAYIELIRGVPLISVLFMASIMIPLFFPEGVTVDKLLRAQIGFTMFLAAYLAEVVRAGLQAIPKGQYEAADALGLGYWAKMRLIVLPQALRLVIPPMVNSFISTFKDTSLVIIIGLVDLLNAGKIAVNDPPWRSFYVEMYVYIALIYFAFCFTMSKFSQRLERDLSKATSR